MQEFLSPFQINKRRCQYAAFVLILLGVLKLSKFRVSAFSDLLQGWMLLFAIGKDNLMYAMFFHYLAFTDTVIEISRLLQDVQTGTSPFQASLTSDILAQWISSTFTVIIRSVAIYLGFRLYQNIKAARYGFIPKSEMALDMFPQYQAAGTSIEEAPAIAGPQLFTAFGGRGQQIGL